MIFLITVRMIMIIMMIGTRNDIDGRQPQHNVFMLKWMWTNEKYFDVNKTTYQRYLLSVFHTFSFPELMLVIPVQLRSSKRKLLNWEMLANQSLLILSKLLLAMTTWATMSSTACFREVIFSRSSLQWTSARETMTYQAGCQHITTFWPIWATPGEISIRYSSATKIKYCETLE